MDPGGTNRALVTLDDIAAAADVGRMTVFNHFVRKEDMFFDRDEEGAGDPSRGAFANAIRTSLIDTLRLLAHRLVAEKSPAVDFSARSRSFVEAIAASETLKARARAIRDEFARVVTVTLCEGAGLEPNDSDAQLAGDLLLSTWAVAFIEGHRSFRQSRNAKKAEAAFLAVIDKGARVLSAEMAGTPVASPSCRAGSAPGLPTAARRACLWQLMRRC